MILNQRNIGRIFRAYRYWNNNIAVTSNYLKSQKHCTANMCSSSSNTTNFVEIERKFVISDNCEDKLRELDAKLLRKISFYDVYYDTDRLDLMLNDHWLRRRDGQWELKCPVPGKTVRGSQTEQYAEYNHCSDILSPLQQVLLAHQEEPASMCIVNPQTQSTSNTSETSTESAPASESSSQEEALATFLESEKCKPIAEFGTERTKYKLGSDVTIDLDMADFGYCLGEIEILVPIGMPTDAAVARIDYIAGQLGVNTDKKLAGKVIVYLERHRPDLYAMLKI